MRLRQVVIAARDLETTVADLIAVLGLEVAYRDPGVAAFGLVNAVLPVGDTFLEVVSPVGETAPARRFLDRAGEGGYMVMVQSERLDADRERVAALGVRVVWQADLDDIRGTHLHPADVGAAILSIDAAEPPASWRWAGPAWERHVCTERVRAVEGVELAAADPAALAARWAAVLGRRAEAQGDGGFAIPLEWGTIRVARAPGATRAHVRGYDLSAADAGAALVAARARGLPTRDRTVVIAGTALRLV